jgi:hypothetical protein
VKHPLLVGHYLGDSIVSAENVRLTGSWHVPGPMSGR